MYTLYALDVTYLYHSRKPSANDPNAFENVARKWAGGMPIKRQLSTGVGKRDVSSTRTAFTLATHVFEPRNWAQMLRDWIFYLRNQIVVRALWRNFDTALYCINSDSRFRTNLIFNLYTCSVCLRVRTCVICIYDAYDVIDHLYVEKIYSTFSILFGVDGCRSMSNGK